MTKENLLYMSAVCKNYKFILMKRNARSQPDTLEGSRPAATQLVNCSAELPRIAEATFHIVCVWLWALCVL